MKYSVALGLLLLLFSAACCAPTFAQGEFSGPAFQQHRERDDMDARLLTPQQKADSDALMRSGLAALQAASSSSPMAAEQDLQTAITDMDEAAPIYHGYRVRSMGAARNAIKALSIGRPKALQRATELVGKAINDAETALASW